jgi:hypothetical protein
MATEFRLLNQEFTIVIIPPGTIHTTNYTIYLTKLTDGNLDFEKDPFVLSKQTTPQNAFDYSLALGRILGLKVLWVGPTPPEGTPAGFRDFCP